MELLTEFNQRVRILERTAARSWESDLRRTSPVDTGLMKSKTTVRDAPGSITATVDTDYALYVSEGTRPHKITAKNKQALSFMWKGVRITVRSVNHPGTQPNEWFTNSVKNLPDRMQRIWAALQ